MKPLKKVGKDDPKGWEQPQDTAFPIIPEPVDDNELPVPYYDSDDMGEVSESEEGGEDYNTDYTSDSSVTSSSKSRKYLRPSVYQVLPIETKVYKTVVCEELDFLQE